MLDAMKKNLVHTRFVGVTALAGSPSRAAARGEPAAKPTLHADRPEREDTGTVAWSTVHRPHRPRRQAGRARPGRRVRQARGPPRLRQARRRADRPRADPRQGHRRPARLAGLQLRRPRRLRRRHAGLAGQVFAALRTRYDLVSFDPRGVGRSARRHLRRRRELDDYCRLDATPGRRADRTKPTAPPRASPPPARRTPARSCRTSAPPTPPATWTSSAPRSATRSSTTSASRTAPNSAASTPPCSRRTSAGSCSTRRRPDRHLRGARADPDDRLPASLRRLRRRAASKQRLRDRRRDVASGTSRSCWTDSGTSRSRSATASSPRAWRSPASSPRCTPRSPGRCWSRRAAAAHQGRRHARCCPWPTPTPAASPDGTYSTHDDQLPGDQLRGQRRAARPGRRSARQRRAGAEDLPALGRRGPPAGPAPHWPAPGHRRGQEDRRHRLRADPGGRRQGRPRHPLPVGGPTSPRSSRPASWSPTRARATAPTSAAAAA